MRLERGIRLLTILLSWWALFAVAHGLAGLPVPEAAAVSTAGAAAAYALFRFIFFRLSNAPTTIGVIIRGSPPGILLLVGGYVVTTISGPAAGWLDLVGTALIATAGMAAGYVAAVWPVWVIRLLRFRSHRRYNPREAILDNLMQVIYEMSDVSNRNQLHSRLGWMWLLERAALTTHTWLLERLRPYDHDTGAWAAGRASGAATALRRIKRKILAPRDGTWDRVIEELRSYVVILATGDIGTLPWSKPPSSAVASRPRWKTSVGILRAVAFAVAPLVTVFVIQPLLHLDTDTLRWAKLIGLAWGVVYLLITVDPSLGEKIEATRSLLSGIRGGNDRPT